jgi:hypothetical protein
MRHRVNNQLIQSNNKANYLRSQYGTILLHSQGPDLINNCNVN